VLESDPIDGILNEVRRRGISALVEEVEMGFCRWALINEANTIYHDTEWGIPVHDDRHMFEHLTLECLQCGLSWDLMLKKREIFRECFDNFDFNKIAAYDESDVERILNTEGMIRSVRKIRAVINNARCCQKLAEEFGSFCDYIWAYSGGKTILYEGHGESAPDVKEGNESAAKAIAGNIPVSNGLSERISKDLKKRGFKYVGAITIYSHLQACGIINDHDKECPCWQKIVSEYLVVNRRRDHEVK
jgi:DNA-3-methyladenine glycosylase I